MNETTTAQAGNTQAAEVTEQKTFTQEEMNKIISERVQKEKAKYGDYEALKEKAAKFDEHEEASKTELQKATEKAEKLEAELNEMKEAEAVQKIRTEVAEKMGVPSKLLTGKTAEDCNEQAKVILEFAKGYDYPALNDGGEVHNTSNLKTSQQFADWMKKNTK